MSLALNTRRAAPRMPIAAAPNLPMAKIDDAIAELNGAGDDGLRDMFLAVRDHACGLAVITRDATPFRLPNITPMLAVVSDGADGEGGPSVLPRPSLRRLAKDCDAVAIIDTHARRPLFGSAAALAVATRGRVIIVETSGRRGAEWLAFVRKANPRIVELAGVPAKGVQ